MGSPFSTVASLAGLKFVSGWHLYAAVVGQAPDPDPGTTDIIL